MAGKIFINYRRGDDPGNTGRLFDRLQDVFKPEQLFLDVDNIAPGLDFVRVLNERIADCDVLLAVIGKGWIDARDAAGNRRLDDPEDFVRLEISSALSQGKRVVPVLVGEAHMPRPDELPGDLRPLARRNAVRLTHERFRSDTQGLVKALQQVLEETKALSTTVAEGARPAQAEEERKRREVPSEQHDDAPPRQIVSAEVASASRNPVLSVRMFNLAAKLESAAKNAGPLLLGFLSITCAFVLMLASQILGFGILKYHVNGVDKDVGFLSAPNWTVVYAVLFPPYLYLFAVLTQRCKFALTSLLQNGVIISPNGGAVAEEALWKAWNESLRKVSILLWGLLIVIVVQTSSEWITTVLKPLLERHAGPSAIDWSTLAAVQSDAPSTAISIGFSCVAYLYMGLALFVYLSILVYGAAFCLFLNTLANPSGVFRIVLRDAMVGKQLSDIGINIYLCSLLGLCAGFMMRLQAIYLESNYTQLSELLFRDVLSFTGGLKTIPGQQNLAPFSVPSQWTGLLEIMFTLLALFAVVYLLYDTFEKARQYYLDNVDNREWRSSMRISFSKKEIGDIRRQHFLATVFPNYVHLAVVVSGVVLSALFIGYGIIIIATILYSIVAFVVMPALRRPNAASQTNTRKISKTGSGKQVRIE